MRRRRCRAVKAVLTAQIPPERGMINGDTIDSILVVFYVESLASI